jgi:hypothetical protein
MSLSWSERRKYTYSGVVLIIILVLLYAIYHAAFSAPPTCFDSKQNGDEEGVDCGGSCALLCQNQTRQPTVAWARSFLVATSTDASNIKNTYTAAAYIQNPNLGAGAHNVPYTFQLFDAQNQLIVERTGATDLPPVQTVPILETNIATGGRSVARTLFAFGTVPVWQRVDGHNVPQMSTTNQQLSADGSRLSLTLQNTSAQDAKNVIVVAVLFDKNGVALAASKSLVALVPRRGSQDVTFTWSGGVSGVVRAEITILPSF